MILEEAGFLSNGSGNGSRNLEPKGLILKFEKACKR